MTKSAISDKASLLISSNLQFPLQSDRCNPTNIDIGIVFIVTWKKL